MANWLKQSTAATVKMGPFLDSTDGNSEETGLTIAQADIRLTKNGGAFAQTNNATGATHDEHGYYGVPLDTTDTDTLGRLRVAIHVTGALAVWQDFFVVPANVFDSLIAGTADLKVDVDKIKTQSVTCAAGVTVLASVGTASASTAQTGDAYARLGAPAGASVSADVAAVKADTGGLRTDYTTARAGYLDVLNGLVAAIWAYATRTLSAFGFSVTVGTNGDKTGYALTSAYDPAKTAAQAGDAMALTGGERSSVADAVWDEAIAGHLTAGSTGAAVNAAGSAGDPWSTPLPGAYGAGTAGNVVGNRLDAAVSSRSTYAGADTPGTTTLLSRIASALGITGGKVDVNDKTGFSLAVTPPTAAAIRQEIDANSTKLDVAVSTRNATAPDNAGIIAIKAKTDNLPAAPAAVGNIPTTDQIVLAILSRKITFDAGAGEFVIWDAAGASEAQRMTPTTDAGALPIIGMAPKP